MDVNTGVHFQQFLFPGLKPNSVRLFTTKAISSRDQHSLTSACMVIKPCVRCQRLSTFSLEIRFSYSMLLVLQFLVSARAIKQAPFLICSEQDNLDFPEPFLHQCSRPPSRVAVCIYVFINYMNSFYVLRKVPMHS